MPELHSFWLRELSHVLNDYGFLSHDLVQGPRCVQDLRHAFPICEMWSSIKSFDAEKPFVPIMGLVVEVRNCLQVAIVGTKRGPISEKARM